MIRPAAFGWNPETAASNRFQRRDPAAPGSARNLAVTEFDALVAALRGAGVEVHALDEPAGTACPDCVFPNNWVSLHHDGTVVLYPMLAPSRRLERRMELLFALEQRGGFAVSRLLDLSHHELSGRFLEGTGSVVFDHACQGRLCVPVAAYECRRARGALRRARLRAVRLRCDGRRGRRRLSHERAALDRAAQRDRLRRGRSRSATGAVARAAAGQRPRGRRHRSRTDGCVRRQCARARGSGRHGGALPCRTGHCAASMRAVSRLFGIAWSGSSRCRCRRSKISVAARCAACLPKCSCRDARPRVEARTRGRPGVESADARIRAGRRACSSSA